MRTIENMDMGIRQVPLVTMSLIDAKIWFILSPYDKGRGLMGAKILYGDSLSADFGHKIPSRIKSPQGFNHSDLSDLTGFEIAVFRI
jgi:hypothetical protein